MKGSTLHLAGRVLQAIGMGVVLVGIFESVYVGFARSESLDSMRVEFTYLGIGGALFLVGMVLDRLAKR
ncbi:MAG TPA: hypothetical protein VKE69_07635 [Planctomycetota bacterium]|nr:hypothetical protein [Planctomycetota bacterium]